MMTAYDPVLLPMMRRVMPQIIAQAILGGNGVLGGLQMPKYSTFANFFDIQEKKRMTLNKELYTTFVRINNRKTPTPKDFIAAKYPHVYCSMGNWNEMHGWCINQFGKNGYIWCGDIFFFKNEDDAMMFRLAGWS